MASKTKYVHVPMYRVSAETKNKGKLLTATRRVRWAFGYASYDALKRRCKGEGCRGEEHEIVFTSAVQSIKVKKIRLTHNGNVIFDAAVPRGDSGISESSNTSPSWQKEFRIKGKNHAAKVLVFGTRVELSFGGLPFEELPEIQEIERNILSLYVAVPRSKESGSVGSSQRSGSEISKSAEEPRTSRRSLEESGLGKSDSHLGSISEKKSSLRQKPEEEKASRRHTTTSSRQYSKRREERKSAVSFSSSSERSDLTEPPEPYSMGGVSEPSSKTRNSGFERAKSISRLEGRPAPSPKVERSKREEHKPRSSSRRTSQRETRRPSEKRSYSVPKTRPEPPRVEPRRRSRRQGERSGGSTAVNSAPLESRRASPPSNEKRDSWEGSADEDSVISGGSLSSASVESSDSSLLSLDLLGNTEKLADYLQSHLAKSQDHAPQAAAATTHRSYADDDDDATSVDISLTPSMAELRMDTWFDVKRQLAPRDPYPYPGTGSGFSPYSAHDLPVMFVGDKETKIVLDASLSAVSPTGVEEMSRASTLKTASTSRESKKSSRNSGGQRDEQGRKHGERQVSQRSIIPTEYK